MTKYTTANMLITSYFAQSPFLVGKPAYKTMINRVIVQIPYFVPHLEHHTKGLICSPSLPAKLVTMGKNLAEDKVNVLSSALIQVLGQCEVRLIRLRYPYSDSKILSRYLAMNVGKYSFTRLQKDVFNQVPTYSDPFPAHAGNRSETVKGNGSEHASLNSMVTGIKLELAGRLTTQRNIPRKTVNSVLTGSLSTTTVNGNPDSSLDFSQYTSKNKLGAYTVKV